MLIDRLIYKLWIYRIYESKLVSLQFSIYYGGLILNYQLLVIIEFAQEAFGKS